MDLQSGFRLSRWTVHPLHCSLSDGETTLHLEPKVMGVLLALAARQGDVVTREQFIQEVWMGRVVGDEVLSRCISLLRSALQDNPREPRYVQTVPRIGYRLVAPVEPMNVDAATESGTTEPSSDPRPPGPPLQQSKATSPAASRDRPAGRSFLAELRRRNVIRVAASYAVIGWIGIEVTSVVLPALGAPDWVHRVITALVMLGWPVALLLAWLYEITPDGIRRESEIDDRDRTAHARRRKLDYVIVSALAIGLLYLLAQRWTGPGEPDDAPLPDAKVPTLAVLPFVNVSDDSDDDYFSDGLTEELINTFSRVDGLRVIARTSSFTYKNHRQDIRTIGRELGAQTLLEGSVRRSGDDLRIAAQLVDAEGGHQIWADSYDGKLEDVFDLQGRITSAIVTELMPTLKERGDLHQVSAEQPTKDMQAYESYLRGRYQLRRREEEPILKSIRLFQDALERDARFAAAYVELATAYALLPYYSYELEDEMFELARQVIDTGIELNPAVENAAQRVLAFMNFRSWRWVDAEHSFRRAFIESPADPSLHQWYSQFLASLGQSDGSLRHAVRAKELDALSPVVNDRLAVAYLWKDEDDSAERQFELAAEFGFGASANPEGHLVSMLRRGDYENARKILETLQGMFGRSTAWIDVFLEGLQNAEARAAAVEALADAGQRGEISRFHLFGSWIYLGETDRAMELGFQLIHDPRSFDLEFLFSREARALRRHHRFPDLVRAIGLDRHWREFGWPESCQAAPQGMQCH